MFPDGQWRTDSVKCGRFGVFVRNMLSLHKRLSINKFHLFVKFDYHMENINNIADDVKMWLGFALDRHAEQILFYAKSEHQFVQVLSVLPNFISHSLVELVLGGCRIDPQLLVNLGSLKRLLLNQICMCDDTFQQFVSGCPALRDMTIRMPYLMKKLSFSDPNIDRLSLLLTSRDKWDPCLLDCPNLKTLKLKIFNCLPEVINVSSIRRINVDSFVYAMDTDEEISILKMFLGKFEAAEVFKLSFDASAAFLLAIENLQLLQTKWKCVVLEILMFHEGCLLGIYQLIRSSTRLKKLILRTIQGSDTGCLRQLPSCVLPQLKTIILQGNVKPCNILLKLVEFLLESAPVLVKLVIVPFKNELNEEDKLEFCKRVSSLPKASTSATIVLK